jgi:hypothetical protein
MYSYGSTKCGLRQFHGSLLKECKRSKVGVHTASPGMVLTELLLRYISICKVVLVFLLVLLSLSEIFLCNKFQLFFSYLKLYFHLVLVLITLAFLCLLHVTSLCFSKQCSVWIDLFKFVYWHKHLWDCLEGLIETIYDMSMSCFQLVSISSPR